MWNGEKVERVIWCEIEERYGGERGRERRERGIEIYGEIGDKEMERGWERKGRNGGDRDVEMVEIGDSDMERGGHRGGRKRGGERGRERDMEIGVIER